MIQLFFKKSKLLLQKSFMPTNISIIKRACKTNFLHFNQLKLKQKSNSNRFMLKYNFSTSKPQKQNSYDTLRVIIQFGKKQTDQLFSSALSLLKQNKFQESFQLIQKVLDSEPQNVNLVLRIAILCDQLMIFQQAVILYKAVLQLQPNHLQKITIKLQLLRCLLFLHQQKQADDIYNMLVAQYPDDQEMKDHYQSYKRIAKIKNFNKKVDNLINIRQQNPSKDTTEIMELIINTTIEPIQQMKQTLSQLLYSLIAIFASKQRFDKVQHYVLKANEFKIERQIVSLYEGVLLIRDKKYVEAIASFQKMKQKFPHIFQVNYHIAICMYNLERFKQCEQVMSMSINKNIDSNPRYSQLSHQFLLISCQKISEFKKTIQYVNLLLEKGSQDKKLFVYRGQAYYRSKNYEKAYSDLNYAIDNYYMMQLLNGGDFFQLIEMRANCAVNLSYFQKAIQDFSILLSMTLSSVKRSNYYRQRAISYFNFYKFQNAINDLNELQKLNPKTMDSELLVIKIICHLSLGQLQEAKIKTQLAMKQGISSSLVLLSTRIKTIQILLFQRQIQIRKQTTNQAQISQKKRDFVKSTQQKLVHSKLKSLLEIINSLSIQPNHQIDAVKGLAYELLGDYENGVLQFSQSSNKEKTTDALIRRYFCHSLLSKSKQAVQDMMQAIGGEQVKDKYFLNEITVQQILSHLYQSIKNIKQTNSSLPHETLAIKYIFQVALGHWDSCLEMISNCGTQLRTLIPQFDLEEQRIKKNKQSKKQGNYKLVPNNYLVQVPIVDFLMKRNYKK